LVLAACKGGTTAQGQIQTSDSRSRISGCPKRCNSDQSRTAFVNEAEFRSMKAPTWRVERGSVAPTKAFNASSCAAVKKPALPPMSKLVRPFVPQTAVDLLQRAGRQGRTGRNGPKSPLNFACLHDVVPTICVATASWFLLLIVDTWTPARDGSPGSRGRLPCVYRR
jgi:hypothetical protein